jgi:D-beta-D-heptose 7-phosphate kinase / D-beta-D-heptose 1-phosphate adenosyltransferase
MLDEIMGAKVLVIGDVMLDRYWTGSVKRISPEAPVPVVEAKDIEERVGGAGNVALNISSLGGDAGIVGFIGKDEDGTCLEEILKEEGVVTNLEVTDCRTITKLRILSQHQQLLRVDFEKGYARHSKESMNKSVMELIDGYQALIISDYGKGTLSDVARLIEIAKSKGIPVLVDPKGTDFSKYYGATLITPNMKEFELVVGKCSSESEIQVKAMKLANSLSVDAILITRSEKGMMLVTNSGHSEKVATVAKEVFDVTGAGDTVIAVMGMALAANYSYMDSMVLANAAAGVVVGKIGTASLSKEELYQAMHEVSDIKYGVLSESLLLREVKGARLQGEKIVMTNGCFDILHAGHVSYLKAARAKGDRLIVAVNDDESISRIKGPSRPIVTLENRMSVLSALDCVDWVISFSEDTPYRVIKKLLPDILVKGADYHVNDIVGSDEVINNGGKVETIDLVPSCSTSMIIQSIVDKNG